MADRDPGALSPTYPEAAPDPILWRSKLPLNDMGNAMRLQERAAGRLLFVGELGRQGAWVQFDGVRWTHIDGDARARAYALQVPEMLLEEVRVLRMADDEALATVWGKGFSDDMRKERVAALFAWSMKTGNSDRSSGMLKQAASLEDDQGRFLMRANLDDFDTDLLAYHCLNGVLRFVETPDGWRSEFTKGHDPADRFMQVAAVAYDPDANCPQWVKRLEQLHDDPVARTAIQRIYGMTLTGLTSDQAFYIYQGKGGDGKSMTNKIIGTMHGDYFRSSSPKTFLQSRTERGGSEHQADIVRLRGDIRMVVIDEPKTGSTWDGERIKQVTGSKITARAPNAIEDVTFEPRFQLLVECNTLPKAPSDDRGFRRRFKLLPWLKTYGVTQGLDDEPPHVVEKRLMAELSGILNWMVVGTLEWLDSAEIPEPEIAAIATSSYWANGSALSEWLEACCDISDPEAETLATPLYEAFKRWCLDRGDKEETIIKQTSFGTALTERQVYRFKNGKGNIVRRGIRLRDADDWLGAAGAAPAPSTWAPDPWPDDDHDPFGVGGR